MKSPHSKGHLRRPFESREDLKFLFDYLRNKVKNGGQMSAANYYVLSRTTTSKPDQLGYYPSYDTFYFNVCNLASYNIDLKNEKISLTRSSDDKHEAVKVGFLEYLIERYERGLTAEEIFNDVEGVKKHLKALFYCGSLDKHDLEIQKTLNQFKRTLIMLADDKEKRDKLLLGIKEIVANR